jgi:hypothetical protein
VVVEEFLVVAEAITVKNSQVVSNSHKTKFLKTAYSN